MKLSFLIAAHNEEKIMRKTLSHFLQFPYESYEVILGLDGCTDKTEEIVKEFCRKSKKFKYYKLNLRKGKPAVINLLSKKATGDLIIINDADWFFAVKSRKQLEKYLEVFKDKKVGGVAESFPIEFYENNPNKGNLGYKMVSYSAYYWLDYQKKRFTYLENGLRYVRKPKLFMTNILRRSLYEDVDSLGDDFERSIKIMKRGYKIVLFDDPSMPRMKALYNKITIRDLFKQKIRTAKAREQIEERDEPIGMGYYFDSIVYMLFRSIGDGFYAGSTTFLWIVLTTFATFYSKLKNFNTREGWTLRAAR